VSVFQPGDKVDLYYYAESDRVRSVTGKIDDLDLNSVTIVTTTGDLQWFPHTAIQRVILLEASERPEAVTLGPFEV
jgi:hypothetical protein